MSFEFPPIAVPTNTRIPSPVPVQVRGSRHLLLSTPWLHQGAIALHTPASSGQHRPPYAEAPPVRMRTGTQGTTGNRPRCVVRSLPYPVHRAHKHRKHPPQTPQHSGKNQTPDFSVLLIAYHPIFIRMSLPGPGSTGVTKRVRGGNADTAHLPLISCSWEILRLRLLQPPAHVSMCILPDSC